MRYASRLDWYLAKRSLEPRQHEAGLRFAQDWRMATAGAKTIASYGLRIAGHHRFSDQQLGARGRIRRIGDLLGRDLAVVIDVCGLDEWAGERLAGLRGALDRLADHYGLQRPSL